MEAAKQSELFKRFCTKKIHEPPDFMSVFSRVLAGTFAGLVATFTVHPLDLIKVRMQGLATPLPASSIARRIVTYEGFLNLYTGLSAGLLRQFTNTSTRLAVYNSVYDKYSETTKSVPSEGVKVLIGIVAGLAGGFMGNPSEVVLVRMLAASAPRAFNGDPDLQELINRRYRNCFEGIVRIVSEEGGKTLGRGMTLTMSRSVFVSAAQIGSYSTIRDQLIQAKAVEGYKLHMLTTMFSSLITSVLSLPIDIVKTRYQVKKRGVTILGIFNDIRRKKGLRWFWNRRVFVPYYVRICIHTMTSFFVAENIHKSYYDAMKREAKCEEG